MTFRLPAKNNPVLVLAASAAMAICLSASQAGAQAPRKYDDRNSTAYRPRGPNVSYQQGPHTRVYITKRSWLDAGVEVLPGDRKFSDYAFPQATSFARENNNRPLDRQPLNPPSDMGGYPQSFPLY